MVGEKITMTMRTLTSPLPQPLAPLAPQSLQIAHLKSLQIAHQMKELPKGNQNAPSEQGRKPHAPRKIPRRQPKKENQNNPECKN